MRRPDDDFLFVYGTLRRGAPGKPGEGNDMEEALAKSATYIGRGRARGRLYRVDWYPGALDSRSSKDVVHGDVYRVPRTLLPLLDEYEDAGTTAQSRREYVRKRKVVRLNDGRSVQAWTYIYNRPVREERRIRSGDFLVDPVQGRKRV